MSNNVIFLPSIDQVFNAGSEADNAPLFVARTTTLSRNSIHPGKLAMGKTHACISYGGKEHLVNDFQVLCRRINSSQMNGGTAQSTSQDKIVELIDDLQLI